MLIKTYGTRMLRSAYLLCGNHTDAQDIVQDTFITAVKSIHKFQGRSAFYTWLHGILINVTRHFLRSRKSTVPLDNIAEPVDTTNHLKQVEQASVRKCLLKVIAGLSHEHREVILLRYFEEMKIVEIADALGISKGTVKSRLHYALKRLRTTVPDDLRD